MHSLRQRCPRTRQRPFHECWKQCPCVASMCEGKAENLRNTTSITQHRERMKLKWKEEEDEGGQERNEMLILRNDMLMLQIRINKNLIS